MHTPEAWRDDPACGHTVEHAFQTHYCTYIRTPRLLTLQRAGSDDELALLVAHQWYELWFKVLLLDLRAATASDGATYEAVKLLKRGVELFRLFDRHADLIETGLVRGAGFTRALSGLSKVGAAPRLYTQRSGGCGRPGGAEDQGRHTHRSATSAGSGLPLLDAGSPSDQYREIARLAQDLPRLAVLDFPGLAEAVADYDRRWRAFRERYARFVAGTLRPAAEGPTYAEWLALDELLSLQEGVKSAWCCAGEAPPGFWQPESVSPDENMFIIVHQCFEVYFKVILNLIDRAIPALLAGEVAEPTRLLQRAVHIQRLLVPQIQLPATMLPLDFMRFRSQKRERDGRVEITGLTPASGTESYQFREIEIVCGLRDDAVFQKLLDGTAKLPVRLGTPRQRERLREPTLPEAFRHAVQQRGLARYDDLFTPADTPNPHLDLALLADTLLAFDEFFRFWRLAHVSMVEKMIGGKSGTGFLGPEYLAETTGATLQSANRVFEDRQVRPRFFEELWAVRTRLSK